MIQNCTYFYITITLARKLRTFYLSVCYKHLSDNHIAKDEVLHGHVDKKIFIARHIAKEI